jgi:prepilin-type N-terminal cleavage/methylation domain-containing protein
MINQKSKIKNIFGLDQSQNSFSLKKNFDSGFTLIEIMVAVSIFSIVMLVAIGAVLSIVSANRKAQSLNAVINNLNFALEGMARDLRTGYDYDCDAGISGLDDCPLGGSEVLFKSSQYKSSVTYSRDVDSNGLGSITRSVSGSSVPLTGNEVNIKSLKFYVVNTKKLVISDLNSDYLTPKIIITVQGEFKGFGDVTEFNLQTMVTQRRLDID